MTERVGQLTSILLDCPDTDQLATFYCRLLGRGSIRHSGPRRRRPLRSGPHTHVDARRSYVPPSWPEVPQHQHIHLDVAVSELEPAVASALALGATEAEHQPAPDSGGCWPIPMDTPSASPSSALAEFWRPQNHHRDPAVAPHTSRASSF
ncbi:VOC family protein [Arthrobacter sp. VKM Ac-2550]|uniref:VOC family protein n=1 Tax=Crystallibacter permensis TaxID=1938888 RepID=UPI0039B4784A